MNEYTKINWQDGTVLQQAKVTIDGTDYEVTPAVESGTTPVNATNLNKMDTALKQAHDGVRDMEVNKINKATIELLTVDSTAPEHCSIGDMYYNTTTNFIYTATGTDTWGTTGETPSSKYLYVDLTNSKLYYYNGTNFTSYGGGASNDVIISDTQPTGDDWKLWIDTGEVGSAVSEITNEYSTSTGLGYSANYVNNNFQTSDYIESSSIQFNTSSQFSGNYSYIKSGNVVVLYFWIVLSANISTPWTTLTLATLPNEIKPKKTVITNIMRDNDTKVYQIRATTDGTLVITDRGRGNITASAEGIPGTLTYIV